MRYRLFAVALLGVSLLSVATAADAKSEAAKKALQEVGDFIGQWNATGEAKINGKNAIWKETSEWGWKFDKATGGAWLAFNSKDGKYATAGTLKFDPEKKLYVFNITTKSGATEEYLGKLTKQKLVVDRKDKNGDVHRVTMFTLADGARLSVKSEIQTGGKGLFSDQFKITATKEGESFAGGGKKKNECIVTGGLGTMAVSYDGKTYYVCCSGCRDEFNADPKKYIAEYEKKKK